MPTASNTQQPFSAGSVQEGEDNTVYAGMHTITFAKQPPIMQSRAMRSCFVYNEGMRD